MSKDNYEFSKDTRRLDPEELSRDQIVAIHAIEDRFRHAQFTRSLSEDTHRPYLAFTEDRHPRVLLLDGARGTGKTSLMLTLAQRWRKPGGDATHAARHEERLARFDQHAEGLGVAGALKGAPQHVIVLDILDFDPLPPGMPLIAALVQAWRPIVREYDKQIGAQAGQEWGTGDDVLMDDWHRLFAMAAAGWSPVSAAKGLVEQVLDREEQVQDWQDLDRHWRSLIDKIIKRGKSLREPHTLDREPVFVIMIDDCDLQVGRVRELLPALRLLYHPRLFFLVAADRPHMVDMLKLDFLGQQNRLVGQDRFQRSITGVDLEEWATSLAGATFEKSFAVRNRWLLRLLSLAELLEFNIASVSFGSILECWKQEKAHPSAFPSLGTYLKTVADGNGDSDEIPMICSYRTAHQILEGVVGREPQSLPAAVAPGTKQAGSDAVAARRAAEVVGRLLGRSEYEALVHISASAAAADVEDELTSKPDSVAPPDLGPMPAIEFLQRGELEAYFPPELPEDISQSARIMLSAQPHFRYYHGFPAGTGGELRKEDPPTSVRKTSAMLAVSLQEDGFGVSTPRLLWDARLTLAWTAINLADHDLALAWPWYRHPSPLRLLSWAREWRKFVVGLRQKTSKRPDRIAYAWIYFQLRWMTPTGLERALPDVADPLSTHLTKEEWDKLLAIDPIEVETEEEKGRWSKRTLPLLARPEIGLTPELQARLLKPLKDSSKEEFDWLKAERRTLITDAILTAADEVRRPRPEDANWAQTVEHIIKSAEERYMEINENGPPPWNEKTPWDDRTEDRPRLQKKVGKK
jgi:hypothetical protein